MALRPFSKVPYLPFLSLRPAEMLALEELPEATKDLILPLVHLRPWTTAYALQSGLDRLTAAYGDRPTVIAVGPPEFASNLRPVHRELAELRIPDGGYRNWCQFIADKGHEHFIPAVQIEDPAHIEDQIGSFYELDRGLVVIIPREALGGLRALVKTVARQTDAGRATCFVIDERRMSRDSLERAVTLVGHCNAIKDACPFAAISISGSSFPHDFKGVVNQDIYERILFDQVVDKVGAKRMIFSDRGSARVERQSGGGLPKPRIDYPQSARWSFFRTETEGLAGYKEVAKSLINLRPAIFEKDLRVWGTLMIERTAKGLEPAIKTPARSTAVRINLHLQRQTFFNNPAGLYDTEDDW
jgi:hypothetical protein